MNTIKMTPALVIGIIALGTAACSSTPAPRSQHMDARTTISAAEAEGAQEVPEASLYLKMARDAVDQAEDLMEENRYEDARPILERAHMDAELALSLAREAKAKEEAQKEIQRVKSLEEANNRRIRDRLPS